MSENADDANYASIDEVYNFLKENCPYNVLTDYEAWMLGELIAFMRTERITKAVFAGVMAKIIDDVCLWLYSEK